MVNAKLVVVGGGDAKAAEVQLKLPTVIGRGKESGLTVPHALVSRRHTEIFERDGKLFVKDLGSLNGTFVNNLRIEDAQPLEPNQLLTLGNVTFRAVYEIHGVASDTDAVSGSDQKTKAQEKKREIQPAAEKVPVGTAAESVEPQVPFDETVPMESISKPHPVESNPQDAVDTEPATIEASDGDGNSGYRSKDLASDTDKSFKTTFDTESPSNIFNVEDDNGSADKSVSISALDGLPSGSSGVSCVSGLDFGDGQKNPVSKIDPAELGLENDGQTADDADNASLGSFLRKMPR